MVVAAGLLVIPIFRDRRRLAMVDHVHVKLGERLLHDHRLNKRSLARRRPAALPERTRSDITSRNVILAYDRPKFADTARA